MDLLSIIGIVWRHKLAAIPVVLFTILGAFYVIAVKAPVYQASSSLLLLSPPGPPSAEQIAANHKLAKINSNNPYVSFDDLPVVADTIIDSVTSSAVEQTLADRGVNPEYQVVLSTDFGSPPIIQITGIGSTAASAIRAASLITSTAVNELYQMQSAQGVNKIYMITATQVVTPTQAQTAASGKLRTLIAVLGIGALLLFVVISVAEAREQRRTASRRPVGVPAPAPAPASDSDSPRTPPSAKPDVPPEPWEPRAFREPLDQRDPWEPREPTEQSRESRDKEWENREKERTRNDRRGAALLPRNGVRSEEFQSDPHSDPH
jgi:capsular polysaccharide biosynthesis protein